MVKQKLPYVHELEDQAELERILTFNHLCFPLLMALLSSSSFLQVKGHKNESLILCLVSHLVLQRPWAVGCCPNSDRVTSMCAKLHGVSQRAFLRCSSVSSRISSSLGKICQNIPPMSELGFTCLPQFSHRQEDRGESGYQEALSPVPVRDLCQESIQGADAIEAHAA